MPPNPPSSGSSRSSGFAPEKQGGDCYDLSSSGSDLRSRQCRRPGRGVADVEPVAPGTDSAPTSPIAHSLVGGAADAAPPHAAYPPAGGSGEPPTDSGKLDVPTATKSMSWTEYALGAWMIGDCTAAAGSRLLSIVKDPRFHAGELPTDARALHRRIEASMKSR